MTKEPFWPWDEGYDEIPDEPKPCPTCGVAPDWPSGSDLIRDELDRLNR